MRFVLFWFSYFACLFVVVLFFWFWKTKFSFDLLDFNCFLFWKKNFLVSREEWYLILKKCRFFFEFLWLQNFSIEFLIPIATDSMRRTMFVTLNFLRIKTSSEFLAINYLINKSLKALKKIFH